MSPPQACCAASCRISAPPLPPVARHISIVCMLLSLFFLPLEVSSQSVDSVTVTFRYDDPTHSKIRVFVPGEFNNWGPNSGGVIAIGAPSQMDYDSAGGYWVKEIRLKVGQSYAYKFHFHLNPSGTLWQWVSDSLNPRLDGTPYGNSLMTVGNPMVFEPVKNRNPSGAVVGVTFGVFSSSSINTLRITAGADTLDGLRDLRPDLRILRSVFSQMLSDAAPIHVQLVDSLLRAYSYDFPVPIPPVAATVPFWAADAVWYQIFPERFRNGDTANDPDRLSLEEPQYVPTSWRISPWTGDWYARDSWEVQSGSDFYNNGVFNRRYGGDLQGVLDKLDYLDSLGITAIYFNPLFYARSLHKYDGAAYQHIDPHFGPNLQGDLALIQQETTDPATWHWSSADSLFLHLLREAHQRGIRVILDGVFDHSGRDFYAFHDLQVNQKNSAYKDWYTVYSFYDPAVPGSTFTYKSWWNYASVPQFATTLDGSTLAPGPKAYIYAICKRWMDPDGDGDPSDGIDGWRLDTVPDVPIGFWTEWNTYVRSINPDIYTVSEVWGDATWYIQNGRFSATMNYSGCAFPVYDYLTRSSSTPSQFVSALTGLASEYGNDVALANQNLLDSHDTERLMSMIVNAPISTGWGTVNSPRSSSLYSIRKPNGLERRLQRLIVLAQMTIPGAPMVYYGDEAGMWGATDSDDRMPMPWPDLQFAPQATDPRGFARTPDDANYDTAVAQYYRSAIALRHRYASLRRGTFQQVAVNDSLKAIAFTRSIPGEAVLTCLNRSDSTVTLSIPLATLPPGASYAVTFSSAMDSSTPSISFVTGFLNVTIPPVAGVLIEAASAVNRTVHVSRGWNMVSVPLILQEHRPDALFPRAGTPAYSYSHGLAYAVADSLVHGIGYWIKYNAPDSLVFAGRSNAADTVALTAGWNLLGAPSFPARVHDIVSMPPQAVTSRFFEYREGYRTCDTLAPGTGYWVQVQEPCNLIFTPILAGNRPSTALAIRIVPNSGYPPAPPGANDDPLLPAEYALDQAYPNPFNPGTTIRYQLPADSRVSLKIYNVLGQLVEVVRDDEEPAGYKEARWDGAEFSSGVYFYRLEATDVNNPFRAFSSTKKMVLVK